MAMATKPFFYRSFRTRSLSWLDLNWQEVRKAYAVFINDPSQGILHILAAGRGSRWQNWVEARLARQAEKLAGQPIAIDLETLRQLPETTLGGAYAAHILGHGYDPEGFVTVESRDSWLQRRMAISHDIHHILTGFDSSPVGEFGLAAFVWVQYRDLLNLFVLSHVPWFMVGHPHLIGKTVRAVVQGWQMGQQSQPAIAYPFEQNWQTPVTEVQRELGIVG